MLALLAGTLIASAVSKLITLEDGGTYSPSDSSDSLFFYELEVLKPDYQLVITVGEEFSENPNTIFVGQERTPNYNDFDWSRTSNSKLNVLVIPSEELSAPSKYGIHFNSSWHWITVQYKQVIALSEAQLYSGFLDQNTTAVYSIEPMSAQGFYALASSVPTTADPVILGNLLPSTNQLIEFAGIRSNVHTFNSSMIPNTTDAFYFSITGVKSATNFTILWMSQEPNDISLKPSTTVVGLTCENSQKLTYSIDVSRELDLSIEIIPQYFTLNFYVAAGRYPTESDYDFYQSTNKGQMILTKAARQRLGLVTGTYYLKVGNSSPTVFWLSVKYRNDAIPLLPGVAYSAEPSKGLDQYSVVLTDGQPTITANVYSASSGGYLYLKQCVIHDTCLLTSREQNNPSEYNISYIHSVTDLTQLEHVLSPGICSTEEGQCEIFIGFELDSPVPYKLTVGSPIIIEQVESPELLDPIKVSEGKSVYLQFTNTHEFDSELKFSILAEGGCVGLYASRTAVPTVFDYEKASGFSDKLGVKFVKGVDGPALKGVYHLLVYGFQTSTFTLQVLSQRPNKEIILEAGVPQSYQVRNNGVKDFTFQMQNEVYDKPTITIVHTQLTGTSKFWASAGPYAPRAWRVSEHFLRDTRRLHIFGNHTNYLPSGDYSVRVEPWRANLNGEIAFSVMYKTSETILNLFLEEPWSDEVLSGAYSYYAVDLETVTQNVYVVVTVLSGSASLFVSFDEHYPSEEFCDKQSRDSNPQILLTFEEIEKSCIDHKSDLHKFNCRLYLSVFGLSVTEYTVQVQLSETASIQLELNEEFSVAVSQRNNQTFSVQFEEGTPASVAFDVAKGILGVFQINSQSDELLTEGKQHPFVLEHFEWLLPTLLARTELKFRVVCTLDDCKYTIKPRQAKISLLNENESVRKTTARDVPDFFRFHCASPDHDLNFTVQALGAVSWYISKAWNTVTNLPSAENYDWAGANKPLVLTQFDPMFEKHSSTLEGAYFLGIYAAEPTEYTLNVRPVQTSVVPLHESLSISLSASQAQYCLHLHHNPLDMSLEWSEVSGSASVYITTIANPSQVYTQLPNELNSHWNLTIKNEDFKFIVRQRDPNSCVDCGYILGIIAEAGGFSAALKTESGSFTRQLYENEELWAEGTAGEIHYYHYEVVLRADTQITVISNGPYVLVKVVNSEDEDAPAIQEMTSNFVVISLKPSDPDFTIGTYSIRVKLSAMCSYVIKAVQIHPIAQLEDAHRVTSQLNTGFLVFQSVGTQGVNTYCNLISLTANFKPKVYVTHTASSVNPPGPQNAEQHYSSEHYTNQTLNFIVIANKYFYIGVYQSETHLRGEFSLDCSIGVPTLHHRLGQTQLYETEIEKTKLEIEALQHGKLVVYLDACSAYYQVEVSRNWNFNSRDTVTAESESEGRLRAVYTVPTTGKYYIQVTLTKSLGLETNSFSLYAGLADANEVSTLEIRPGNNGSIRVRQGNSVKLSWAKAQYSNGTALQESIVYDVYLTKALDSFYATPCSIELAPTAKKITVGTQHSTSLSINNGNKYQINVVGHTLTRSIAYTPTTVAFDRVVAETHWGVWLLVALVTLVVLAVVGYGTYRWRQRKHVNNVELSAFRQPTQLQPTTQLPF